MIESGNTMMLDIIETNMLGNGVAKVDDMVVFCRGAVEGDTVAALVTDVRKNYAEAKCLEIVSPSKHRKDAACPHAAECGGCVFDGVTYDHETEVKKRGITSAMRREGILSVVSDFIGTECTEYRNKAVFHFDENKNCGFFAAGTDRFVKIEKCLICNNNINEIKNEVESLLKGDAAITADELTYLYIRYMKGTDEASVVIGYTGRADISALAENLSKRVTAVKCVMRGRESSPEAKGESFDLLFGREKLAARIADLDMEISPKAFFQVNRQGAEALCETVKSLADIKEGERAADLYCGTGLFGLALAKSSPKSEIYGIELNEDAVHDANRNAARNGIENAFFLAGDSSELVSKTGIDGLDVAIVDPPRTGLSKKTVAELKKLSPKRIIYVSCNPSTLARDIKSLSDSYDLKEVVGVDMFPRTKHVETVTLITRACVETAD